MVKICVPDAISIAVAVARTSSEHAVPTTVGNPPELLDVDVHELPWRALLISDGLLLSDGEPTRDVEVREKWHPIADQHPTDRRSGDAKVIADSVWSPSPRESETNDAPFDLLRGTRRGAVRSG